MNISALQNGASLQTVDANETQKKGLANLFLLLAIVFGVLLIFLEPPFVCPDENAHFINICRISRGGLFADVQNGEVGSYVTDEELDFLLRYGGYYNGPGSTVRYDYLTMRELSEREASETIVFFPTEHATLNPVSYLISSFAVAFMRLFGSVNAYGVLLYAKLANLLFYAFVTRWAILKTGAFRNTMFLLALMPMAIFQGASTSYDAVLIPSAFLLFAYATRILCSSDDYRIGKEDIFAVCFASAFLFGSKIAYAPLVLILLSVSVKKFGGWKKWGICVGSVAGVGMVFYLLPTVITAILTRTAVAPLTETQVLQNAYFAENWWRFPSVIFCTLRQFGGYWIETFVGVLGWLDTFFPAAFIGLFLLISTANALLDVCSTGGIRLNTRVLSLVGFAVFFVGTLYTMYVKWNPVLVGIVGGDIAYGGQGRYFIPVALFVLIAFANPLMCRLPVREKLEAFRQKMIRVTAIASLSLTVVLLMARYWM